MSNPIDKKTLIDKIVSSSGGRLDKKTVDTAARGDVSALMSALSEEDKAKLNEALSDKEKARQLLSSDAAKQLLSQLFNK